MDSSVFLTWRWFFGISLNCSLDRLVHYKEEAKYRPPVVRRFSVMLMSSFLDVVGIALGLWSYPFNVFPLMPEFIPFDICALPVATMVLIQIFPKVEACLQSSVLCRRRFVHIPAADAPDQLYDPMQWQNYYSFPILAGIYMAADFFATRTRFEKLK